MQNTDGDTVLLDAFDSRLPDCPFGRPTADATNRSSEVEQSAWALLRRLQGQEGSFDGCDHVDEICVAFIVRLTAAEQQFIEAAYPAAAGWPTESRLVGLLATRPDVSQASPVFVSTPRVKRRFVARIFEHECA